MNSDISDVGLHRSLVFHLVISSGVLFTASASCQDKLADQDIDPGTVATYERLGAVYGGFVNHTKKWSAPRRVFKAGRTSAFGWLPGFQFKKLPSTKLPEVAVPFGLDLGESDMTSAELGKLAHLTTLVELELGTLQLTDEGVLQLRTLKKLSRLHLARGAALTDTTLRALRVIKLLDALDEVLYLPDVTGVGLKELALRTKRISSLDFTSGKVTGADLMELLPLVRSEFAIDLEHEQVTNECLGALCKLGLVSSSQNSRPWRLTFRVDRTYSGEVELYLPSTRITDDGVKQVAQLANLTCLSLDATEVTDQGVKELTRLKKLTQVGLRRTKVTDVGLVYLVAIKNLKELDLGSSKVTDQGVKELVHLERLTQLSLRDTITTDEGAKWLAGIRNLSQLDLALTKVTDESVDELARMTNLTTLDVGGTKVTQKGLATLRAALPNCRIRD